MTDSYISLNITGIEEAVNYFEQLGAKALAEALQKAGKKAAPYALQTLKSNTPVDTGNLRDSEKIKEQTVTRFVVGPDLAKASYAPFVELGHHTRSGSFVPGQFFVELTALEIARPIRDIYVDEIQKAIQSIKT